MPYKTRADIHGGDIGPLGFRGAAGLLDERHLPHSDTNAGLIPEQTGTFGKLFPEPKPDQVLITGPEAFLA